MLAKLLPERHNLLWQQLGFQAKINERKKCDVLVIKKYGDSDVDPTIIKQLKVDSARVIMDVR